MQKALGTRFDFSIAFHPQIDGQFERTIQTLEDMLRASVLDFKGSWASHLPLMEFVTIIVTIQVLQQHLLRLCMGQSVDPQFVGMMLENEKILGPEIIQRTCEKVN